MSWQNFPALTARKGKAEDSGESWRIVISAEVQLHPPPNLLVLCHKHDAEAPDLCTRPNSSRVQTGSVPPILLLLAEAPALQTYLK